MENVFDPNDLLRPYVVVRDYARAEQLQVYPANRFARIPMAKLLGQVMAFDHADAAHKAEKFRHA